MRQISRRGTSIMIAGATTLWAGAALAAPVTVTDAWLRALPANLPAAGYFTLHNGKASMITLNGADSPACGMLMLHKSEEMNGVSAMSDVSRIDVPAGGIFQFAPGSYHLMCMHPTATLRPGANVPVALHFLDGSRVIARFSVRSATGQ